MDIVTDTTCVISDVYGSYYENNQKTVIISQTFSFDELIDSNIDDENLRECDGPADAYIRTKGMR